MEMIETMTIDLNEDLLGAGILVRRTSSSSYQAEAVFSAESFLPASIIAAGHYHQYLPQKRTRITELNRDLLAEILRRSSSGGGLAGLQSHVNFSRVCSSWWSVAAENNPYKQLVQVPWLMLSKLAYNQKTRSFLCFGDEQIHDIKFSDEANSSWCSGSSEGWLVMTHNTTTTSPNGCCFLYNPTVTQDCYFLYNPITQDRISLPPLDDFVPKVVHFYRPDEPDHQYTKIRPVSSLYLTKTIVVTSSSLSSSSSYSSSSPLNHHHHPGHHDIVAVTAIFYQANFMGFCRPGDTEWQVYTHPHIPKPNPEIPARYRFDIETEGLEVVNDDDACVAEYKFRTERPMFADVIVYRGALYAITQHTAVVGVFKFDNSSGSPRVIPEIQWLNMRPMKLLMIFEDWNYLVESCDGELLMVVRRRKDAKGGTEAGQRTLRTWRFLVFKLDESSDPMKWVRIKSLGDQILFLGINHSKSFRASDIPGAGSGNCIYFTTDLTFRHLYKTITSWPNPSRPYTCNDTGVFYMEDGRIESSSRSFFTPGNAGDHFGISTPPSTLEYPAIFITPNPSSSPIFITPNTSSSSSSSSSFTIPEDNHVSSKCTCWQNEIISAISVVVGTIAILGSGLVFLKLLPRPPPKARK